MLTFIALLATYGVALIIRKKWGKQIGQNALLRDTDLSFSGLIGALAISAAIVVVVSASSYGMQVMASVLGEEEVAYAQTQVMEAETGAENQPGTESLEAIPEEDSEEASDQPIETSEIADTQPLETKPLVKGSDDSTKVTTTEVKVDTPPVPLAPTQAPTMPEPSSQFADGVYTGTGYGFKGPITVSVSIASGQISSVEVTDQREDRKWFLRAYSGVVKSVLSAQSADVDTVSGATFSSRGIIDGVAEALERARAAVQ